MAYNVSTNSFSSPVVEQGVDAWRAVYKDQYINMHHDFSELGLVLPDDCLAVAGPPRLSDAGDGSLTIIGFFQSLQYSETSQVQPLKSIGSRRHIFAKTNSPVQGSIGRLLFMKENILKVLYKGHDISEYADVKKHGEKNWYSNLEEDIFRIPFGLGVIYSSPAALKKGGAVAAEYIEACTLQNRQSMVQSGQAMIMEQVQFMADRVQPWDTMVGTVYGS